MLVQNLIIKAVIMGLIDKVIKTVNIWLPDEQQENYEKGKQFEQYVANLFNHNYYTIKDWTRDNSDKRQGIYVESDRQPDFIIRFKSSNELFAVECKWRNNPYYSEKLDGLVVNWSSFDKINRYKKFEKEEGIPVFVVIGLGGEPLEPGKMFCLPLSEAKYPEMYLSVLYKYERPPKKPFFWRNGVLK